MKRYAVTFARNGSIVEANVFIPEDFMQKDLCVDTARHIIFSTTAQLNALAAAKTWFLDATFCVVRKPLYQLFSIHCMAVFGPHKKQIPPVYVMMSRRQTKDYFKVLDAVLGLIQHNTNVERCLTDFEAATWKAVRQLLPGIALQGCNFHWRQAVWKHVQHIGLAVEYNSKESINKKIKQLMALPLLPLHQIRPQFTTLAGECATSDKLRELCNYVEQTWLGLRHWTPENWCCYRMETRTNNDLEAYHRALNSKTRPEERFYELVSILKKEAEQVPQTLRLLQAGLLSKQQKTKHRDRQNKLFHLWDRYERQEINTAQLLEECSELFGTNF